MEGPKTHGTWPRFSAQELVPESRTRYFAHVSCILIRYFSGTSLQDSDTSSWAEHLGRVPWAYQVQSKARRVCPDFFWNFAWKLYIWCLLASFWWRKDTVAYFIGGEGGIALSPRSTPLTLGRSSLPGFSCHIVSDTWHLCINLFVGALPIKWWWLIRIRAVLECDFSWTSLNESNVYGGIRSSSSNTVLDCQETCTREADCTGVDFNADNPPGSRCFLILTDSPAINVGQTPGVTHYSLAKNCELFRFYSTLFVKVQKCHSACKNPTPNNPGRTSVNSVSES